MSEKVRVLVIDDAGFMVKALTQMLAEDDDIEVVGAARNGEEGLQKIVDLKPDVVTLDVDMPIMDGISTVRHIMIKSPVPVVMLSSLFEHGDITFEALRLGVVDFLPKPSGAISKDIMQVKNKIVDRVKIAASQKTENVRRVKLPHIDDVGESINRYRYQSLDCVVVIGTTLGGPNTVVNLMTHLAPDLPVTVVVVQELAPQVMPAYVKKFAEHSPWKVQLAKPGMVLEQGVCYISAYQDPVTIALDKEKGACLAPAWAEGQPLDNVFSSAAEVFVDNVIGVLLSGVGNDGQEGFSSIKRHSGTTMAQATNTCVYPNLTQCAIEHGVVDDIVDAGNLVGHLKAVVNHKVADSGVFQS